MGGLQDLNRVRWFFFSVDGFYAMCDLFCCFFCLKLPLHSTHDTYVSLCVSRFSS